MELKEPLFELKDQEKFEKLRNFRIWNPQKILRSSSLSLKRLMILRGFKRLRNLGLEDQEKLKKLD